MNTPPRTVPYDGASAGKDQVVGGVAVRPALQPVAVEEVDALPGGPAHVLPAELAAVDDDPHEAVDTGAARFPQGRGAGPAPVLARRHRAERDVEFAAAAVPGVQAGRAVPAQVGDVSAVAAQHPRGRHH